MRGVPRLPWPAALTAAILGGLSLDLATPSFAWWPAAFVGTALIHAAVWQQRAWVGFGLGAAAGAAFWGPHISWLTLYLGPVPWLGLCAVMVFWFALFGAGAALATTGLRKWARVDTGRPRLRLRWVLTAQVLAVTGMWMLREQVQSVWPYGGFAWGRLAHTQAESPLSALVSWLGVSGLSALVALACAVPVAACFALPSHRVKRATLATGAVGLALVSGAVVPPAALPVSGSITVAAVQGNAKSGIFDDRENGDVIRVHLEETERLLDELDAEGTQVDVIVWPENSGEFALPDQFFRSEAVQRLAERADAPIVLGSVLEDPDGTFTNSTIVVDGEGVTELRYDKRRPVPFAEYMPNRSFFRALAPDLVDLVQLDYAHGTRPSVLEVPTRDGTIAAGIAICFDIIFDDHAVAMMADAPSGGGAQVIFAQTNNADFGRTDESAQQLQIARLRAIETGRALVNISTVGTSAIVDASGRDIAALETHVAGSMVAEVPLVSGRTPALMLGAWIAGAWMLFGGLGGVLGAIGYFSGAPPRRARSSSSRSARSSSSSSRVRRSSNMSQ